jgi:amidophosphoribosyltransferase
LSGGRDAARPQFCDACFSGVYPIAPADQLAQGRIAPVAVG